MTSIARKRPPTVSQLLRLLNKCRVKCITRFKVPQQIGEWRPDEGDSEVAGTIVIATKVDSKRGFDVLILSGLHELAHGFFQVNCNDNRFHHDKIYRWETLLFKSRTLREAMSVRVGNAYVYGVEDP